MNNYINSIDLPKSEKTVEKNSPKRKGPPNRMNDLAYKEWMKFQKSFFWYDSDFNLTNGLIHFFTKEKWEDGSFSSSLILAPQKYNQSTDEKSRLIYSYSTKSIDDIFRLLKKQKNDSMKFDFIFIDISQIIVDNSSLNNFLNHIASTFFYLIRSLLKKDKYCTIKVDMPSNCIGIFPIPWAISISCREHLKLRDEKIGIRNDNDKITYCVTVQSEEDKRQTYSINPKGIMLGKSNKQIPTWLIPKPPPRKKNEILHPAKYPETLIEKFINLFTKPGDTVFDPMVGTGSTVIAALNLDRNGYGIDLSSKYINISKQRVLDKFTLNEKQLSLFKDFDFKKAVQLDLFSAKATKGNPIFIEGNAKYIEDISELEKVKFDYVCTSPPYWSMLSNPGSEGQKKRREKNLPLTYSISSEDVGNIDDYDHFLRNLVDIYNKIAVKLKPNGFLTIIIKNIKRDHTIYPLAWDLLLELSSKNGNYEYIGTTMWCQDDIGLKPFAVGIVWVSNTVHNYCIHFRKREA